MGKGNVNDKLPRGYMLAWTSRGLSLAVNVVLLMQITFFATEYLGLKAGLVGSLLLASKIFDGFTDIAIGFIIDRTNTKWGKARPYELFIIPIWALTVIIFSCSPEMSITGKSIFLFVLYNLINSVCATALSGAEGVFMARSLDHEVQRAKVLAGSGVLIMMLSAVGSMILPQLMVKWGNQPGGWTKIALTYAVPMTLIGLCRFIFIKEKNVEELNTQPKLQFKECLQAVGKNKYIFILGATFLLANIIINIASVVGSYFFSYVLGDLSLLSLVGLIGLVGPFILLLFPVAMKKIGAMNFIRVGFITAFVGNMLKFFGSSSIAAVVAGQTLSGIGSSTITMLGGLFIIQCMDYGEWKTGKRVEGFMNSVTSFSTKVGAGLASVVVGFVMGATGYDSAAAQQTAGALAAIKGLYSWIPAILCLLMLIFIQFYNLDKKMPEIKKDLEERRNVQNAE